MYNKYKRQLTKEEIVIAKSGKYNVIQLSEMFLFPYYTLCRRLKSIGFNGNTNRRAKLEGLKFGRLTVLKFIRWGNNRYDWECLCNCGNTTYIDTTSLIKGNVKSFGCYRKGNKRKPDFYSLKYEVYYSYKKNATKRNIEFNLSFEEMMYLCSKNCFYCGNEPSNKKTNSVGNFIYNGIDRVDNTKGYFDGNVVSCCKKCNKMKSDFLLDNIITAISGIYRNRISSIGNFDICELNKTLSTIIDVGDYNIHTNDIKLSIIKSIYRVYKGNSIKRKHNFLLNFYQFKYLISCKCYYCGRDNYSSAHKKGITYSYNGIDRIDNSNDYVIGNVVPCCHVCNIIKGQDSLEEFYFYCVKLYKNFIINGDICMSLAKLSKKDFEKLIYGEFVAETN